MNSAFAAVGLGTGPSTAVSRSALTALRKSDEIYCPRSRNSAVSHSRERLVEIEDFPGELIEYPLAMQEGGDPLRKDYREAAESIYQTLSKGQNATAVTVGDPFFYSTLGPLLDEITNHLSPEKVRTIPGVCSVQTAASKLNRPLVQGMERFAMVPVSAPLDLSESLFDQFETIAFTKVNRDFDRLIGEIGRRDRLDSSYLFERLGSDRETVKPLSELEGPYDPPYFSLVLSFRESLR